jgi:hypothetical protein
MDGELLRDLYHHLFDQANSAATGRFTYSDSVILFVYFVGASADRSLRWAHQKRNWPLWARRLAIPSTAFHKSCDYDPHLSRGLLARADLRAIPARRECGSDSRGTYETRY